MTIRKDHVIGFKLLIYNESGVFCYFFKDLMYKIKDLVSWQRSQIQQGFSANLAAKLFFEFVQGMKLKK